MAFPLTAGYLGGYAQTATQQQELALRRQQMQIAAGEAFAGQQIRREAMAQQERIGEAEREARRGDIGFRLAGRQAIEEQRAAARAAEQDARNIASLQRAHLRGATQLELATMRAAQQAGIQGEATERELTLHQPGVLRQQASTLKQQADAWAEADPFHSDVVAARKASAAINALSANGMLTRQQKDAQYAKIMADMDGRQGPKPKTAQEKFDQSTAYWTDPNTGHKYPVVWGKSGPQIVPAAIKADTDRDIAAAKSEADKTKQEKAEKTRETNTIRALEREINSAEEREYTFRRKEMEEYNVGTETEPEMKKRRKYTDEQAKKLAKEETQARRAELDDRKKAFKEKYGDPAQPGPSAPSSEPQAMGPVPGVNPQEDVRAAMSRINDWLGPMAEGRTT